MHIVNASRTKNEAVHPARILLPVSLFLSHETDSHADCQLDMVALFGLLQAVPGPAALPVASGVSPIYIRTITLLLTREHRRKPRRLYLPLCLGLDRQRGWRLGVVRKLRLSKLLFGRELRESMEVAGRRQPMYHTETPTCRLLTLVGPSELVAETTSVDWKRTCIANALIPPS